MSAVFVGPVAECLLPSVQSFIELLRVLSCVIPVPGSLNLIPRPGLSLKSKTAWRAVCLCTAGSAREDSEDILQREAETVAPSKQPPHTTRSVHCPLQVLEALELSASLEKQMPKYPPDLQIPAYLQEGSTVVMTAINVNSIKARASALSSFKSSWT